MFYRLKVKKKKSNSLFCRQMYTLSKPQWGSQIYVIFTTGLVLEKMLVCVIFEESLFRFH